MHSNPKVNKFIIVLILHFCFPFTAKGKIQNSIKKFPALVSLEIRFCAFPDKFKTGILFINGKKKAGVKSGSRFVFSFPADSSIHLKIKLGKNEYVQDGNFITEKNGGVINVEYFFLFDSSNLAERAGKSVKFNKRGWIGVDYWPGFRVRERTKTDNKGLGKVPPGGYRDGYGCLPSGGYKWSDAAQSCIRLWESGVSFQKTNTGLEVVYPDSVTTFNPDGNIVFSSDGEWAEIFTTENWDKNSDKHVWLLRKYGDEWRYSDRMLIEIKKEEGNEKLNIYINKIKSYTIIKS